jgi:hypothetical protein
MTALSEQLSMQSKSSGFPEPGLFLFLTSTFYTVPLSLHLPSESRQLTYPCIGGFFVVKYNFLND